MHGGSTVEPPVVFGRWGAHFTPTGRIHRMLRGLKRAPYGYRTSRQRKPRGAPGASTVVSLLCLLAGVGLVTTAARTAASGIGDHQHHGHRDRDH
jgi:hypothetical protein